MSEEDTKSHSSTSSVLSIGKKLTINTKGSEFDKFFKLVAQQFSAVKGYEEDGHALSTGAQLAHPHSTSKNSMKAILPLTTPISK